MKHLGRVRRMHPATLAFCVGVAISVVVWVAVGRHQWFVADDWAFLVTRERMRILSGYDDMLLAPQDGHWMTPAILVFRVLRWSTGYRSYWPYLAVLLASHLAIVLCVRSICLRLRVNPWTATLICGVLLVFGSGWENILFAVQITYNFTLLGFLAQILLTDHDGPVDRRDVIGSGLAVIGTMSSGFGPFFILGIAVFLGLRKRWAAMAVAVLPQGLAYAWWWFVWGDDAAADKAGRAYHLAPRFALDGLLHTFQGLVVSPWLAGGAGVLALTMLVWRRIDWPRRQMMVTLAVTAVVMYLGIGVERAAIGLESAVQSRYMYMAAMLVAPILALGLDQAVRFAPWAIWLPRLLLVVAIGQNIHELRGQGGDWARESRDEQRIASLLAGYDRTAEADHLIRPLPNSPDISVGDIPELVARHAIVPRTPTTPAEIAEVDRILKLAPASP
jgi:hypothetical protein